MIRRAGARSRRRRTGAWSRRRRAGAWLLPALLFAAPAAGDWLVLRDGTRLETEGPWQVKGRQVVFTRPGGTLAALRLADVDLESSAEATEAGSVAAEPPPAAGRPARAGARRPSVLVLTDDDLRPGDAESREASSEADGESGEASEGTAESGDDGTGDEGAGDEGAGDDDEAPDGVPEEPVVVVSWREQESTSIDGLEIVGSVRNRGRDVAAAIRVQVRVSDEDGEPLAETRAFLEKSSLAPGRTSTFRALLPGIYVLLEEPVFEVTSESFTMQLVTGSEGEADDEYADEYAEPIDELEDYGEYDELEPSDDLEDEGGGS